jgi:hypothetical protein
MNNSGLIWVRIVIEKLREYVLTKESGEFLRLSRNTLITWAEDGRIVVRWSLANGYCLFPGSDLEEFLHAAAEPELVQRKLRWNNVESGESASEGVELAGVADSQR